MFKKTLAVVMLGLFAGAIEAATMTERTASEFKEILAAPKGLTSYTRMTGQSTVATEFETLVFDSFMPGTTGLKFNVVNRPPNSNPNFQLPSRGADASEWHWTVDQNDAGFGAVREVFASYWWPSACYNYYLPDAFAGPLLDHARYFGVNAPNTLREALPDFDTELLAEAEVPAVPLPGTLPLLLAGLLAFGFVRGRAARA